MSNAFTNDHLRGLEYDAEQLCSALSKRCELFCCEVHSFAGRFKIDGAKVVISDSELDETVATRSSWRILPEEWNKKISVFSSKIRTAIRKKGLPFRNGVYLIKHEDIPEVVERVQALQEEYGRVADELVENWDEVSEKIRERIFQQFQEATLSEAHTIWEALQKKIPHKNDLRRRFSIVFSTWAIGGGSSGGIEAEAALRSLNKLAADANEQLIAANVSIPASFLTMRQELDNYLAALASGPRSSLEGVGLSQEAVRSLRTASRQMMEDCLERAFAEPRQELLTLVQGLITRLEGGVQVQSSTVNAVRRAWSKLQAFSFLSTAELEEKLNAGLRMLDNTDVQQAVQSQEITERLLQSIRETAAAIEGARTSRRFIEV